MILHSTPLFELEHFPEINILKIRWFDIKELPRQEVESGFALIREAIQKYSVLKLLVDSSRSTFLFDTNELVHVSNQYLMALAGTKLKKVARISSKSAEREKQYMDLQQKVFFNRSLKIEFRNFNSEKEALKWLEKA